MQEFTDQSPGFNNMGGVEAQLVELNKQALFDIATKNTRRIKLL